MSLTNDRVKQNQSYSVITFDTQLKTVLSSQKTKDREFSVLERVNISAFLRHKKSK